MVRMHCTITAYVQRYMQRWAHSWGFPFLGSIWRARIRVPMNRILSMGAKFTVSFAIVNTPMSFVQIGAGPPICTTVRKIATPRYTAKNCQVILITHETAGLTGGGLSPQISLGASIK